MTIGESKINYKINANKRTFIFRYSLKKENKKSRNEFKILKALEKLGISQKPYLYCRKNKHFKNEFMIIEFLKGRPIKENTRLRKKQLANLAEELAAMHNLKKINIQKNRFSYNKYFKWIKENIKSIKSKTASETDFLTIVNKITKDLRNSPLRGYNLQLITHGDVAPQNLIEIRGKLKLIDWEYAGLGDPAGEIAFFIDDIGSKMSKNEKEYFIQNYLKKRKDPKLVFRINEFIKFIRLGEVLWGIERIFDIRSRPLHEEYLKKQPLRDVQGYFEFRCNKLIESFPEYKEEIIKLFSAIKKLQSRSSNQLYQQ